MYLVFDHEAKVIADNFLDNGISYLSYYRSDTDVLDGFFEQDLDKFKDLMNQADTIVGYNIFGYDFPVLRKYYDFDLATKNVIDIFKIIADEHKIYLKLDNLTTTTFGGSKIAHGLDAVRFYKEGKLDKLKEYCDMDVKLTKDLYEFIKENGFCYYTDGMGQKIKLTVSVEPKPKQEDLFGGLF